MRTLEEVRTVLDQVEAVVNEIVEDNEKYDRVSGSKDWAYVCTTSDVLSWVLGVGMQTSNFLSELKLGELKATAFGER